MKTQETCSSCRRLFFVSEKEMDPVKRSYCQDCRNRGTSRKKLRSREIQSTTLKDVRDLIWLENRHPDILERLRYDPKKRLNKKVRINKGRVSD